MRGLQPDVVVAILRSATTPRPDPRVDEVLQAFRREWEAIAALRYPRLGHARDDAVQQALLKLISPDKLAGLHDPTLVRAWGRSVFVNTVIDMLREHRLEWRHRADLSDGTDDTDAILRDRLPAPGPDPEAALRERERLALALEVVQQAELLRLRVIDGVPEKTLAARFGLSRDGVAGQVKRLRRRIRALLGDGE